MNINQNKIPPGTGRKESAMQELAKRELARRSYREYLAYAHDGTWIRTRMSSFIADEVQKFIEADTGHAYDILVVNCPPQHGKSMTISESLPSWVLGKYPEKNIIVASYDSDFAERFCKKNKMKIRSVGKKLFGIEIGSIDRAAEFELSNGIGRQPGEPLCPELGKDAVWLQEFRESYIHEPLGGQRAWTAMYLCAPKVPDGNLVKREWWKRYSPKTLP